MFETPFDL